MYAILKLGTQSTYLKKCLAYAIFYINTKHSANVRDWRKIIYYDLIPAAFKPHVSMLFQQNSKSNLSYKAR